MGCDRPRIVPGADPRRAGRSPRRIRRQPACCCRSQRASAGAPPLPVGHGASRFPPEALDLLERIPILSVLAPRVLDRLAIESTRETAVAGSVVVQQGDPADTFYVIRSGAAAVTIDGEPIRDLGPGAWFGELALLHDSPRTATGSAATELDLLVLGRRPSWPSWPTCPGPSRRPTPMPAAPTGGRARPIPVPPSADPGWVSQPDAQTPPRSKSAADLPYFRLVDPSYSQRPARITRVPEPPRRE